ncbi:MAG: hypothetical protein DWQ46_07385 [Planctomycetota bacterium]|nr:MAG: hypothetical protein DWQ46_07385 [Planctomycetota bacterium]
MFRRGGQRDSRRRRVLTDDVVRRGQEGLDAPGDSQKVEGASYAPEASLERQPRLSAVVPRRLLTHLVVFALGGGAIFGLLSLYACMQPWQSGAATGSEVFDLTSGGSLTRWFASVLLLASSAASLIVLSLRRHKLNDYQGRYRVWAYAAIGTLLMSAAATAPYHLVAASALAEWTAWELPGGVATFWMAPALLILGGLAVRLLVDMRDSVLACFALFMALLAYGGAIGMQLGGAEALVVGTAAAIERVQLTIGCQLAGHLLLLTSILLFARHVLRDIQGLVARKSDKASIADDADAGEQEDESTGEGVHGAHASPPAPKMRTDLESESAGARSKRRREAAERVQEEYEDRDSRRKNRKIRPRGAELAELERELEAESDGAPQKLSKAQRKKLRKLKARQREAA